MPLRRLGAHFLLLAILATAFAGCSSPVPDTEAHMRIKGLGGGPQSSSSCHLYGPPLFEWCVVTEDGFGEFECNPPQAIFSGVTQLGFYANAGGQPAPAASTQELAVGEDAYVSCEYAFIWNVTARSMMPDSTFTATAHHAGVNETKSCRIGSSGECSVAGRLEGALRFDGPGETLNLLATWEGRLVGMDGQPVPLPGGQGAGEHSWDLRT